jgi:hypothetical protein
VPKKPNGIVPEERILQFIIVIRSEKVILDYDLARLYGVETRRLNEQVRRNIDKYPDDFMFQLTKDEFSRSENKNFGEHISELDALKTALVTSIVRRERRCGIMQQ